MPDENKLGGSVGLDITDFRKGVSELKNQIKNIETGFRASAVTMEDWGNTSNGLKERVSSLKEEISKQKQEMEIYRQELTKVSSGSEADQKAADSLTNKMYSLQKQIGNNEKDFQKYNTQLAEVEKSEKSNSSATGQLGQSFMNMAEKSRQSLASMTERSRQSTSRIKEHFGNLKSAVAGYITGIISTVSLKEVIEDTDAAEKNLSQMTAVLKSTGDASGMTKEKLVELAEAQSKLTTYSAETTEKAENMLLTFTNIKSSVFPQTIQATEDMATAMHMDATQAALQLGKALNDPAKGYSKLQRVGVTFTASQVKTIKAMEKAGNTAGAQKIILQELEKEYGDSAKAAGSTLTGQIQRMENNIKSSGVQIMGALLPVIQNLMPSIVKGVQGLSNKIQAHKAQIVTAFSAIGNFIKAFLDKIQAYKPQIMAIFSMVKSGIQSIFADIQAHKTQIIAAFTAVGNGIKVVFGWVQSHGKLVKDAIIGIVSAMALWKTAMLVANTVQAVNNALTVKAAIAKDGLKAGEATLAAAKGSTTLATMALSAATIKDTALNIAHATATVAQTVATKAAGVAQQFFNTALKDNPIGIVITLLAALVAALVILYNKNKTFHDWVVNAFKKIEGIAKGFVTVISDFFTVTIPGAFNSAKSKITSIWNEAVSGIKSAWDTFKTYLSNPSLILQAIKSAFSSAVDWIRKLPSEALQWGKDFIQGFVNGIKSTIAKVTDAVKSVAQEIHSFLHFSKPDKGPLADADQYGKDFMLLLEKSIKQYKDKPGDAAKEVASLMSSETAKVKDNMTASVKELNSQLEALEGRRTTALKSNSAARVSIAGRYASKIKAIRNEISSLEKGKGNNSARIKALKAEISELESAEKKSSKNVKTTRKNAISDEYNAKITAIKKKIAAVKDESNQEIASIKKVGNAYKAALEKQKEENDAFVKGVNSLEKEVEDALKNEYTAQEQAAENAINKELDALEAWKTAQEDAINSVYTLRENAIQAQIDALDKETDAEDRADTRKGYTDKIADLQLQITYSHDDYNKAQLQKQLAAEQADYQKELDKEAKDDKKAALQNQLDSVKNEQASEIQSIDNTYNAKKTALDNQLQATKDTYAKMETDAALEVKAEQMIMADNQTAIVNLLKSYSSDYASAGSDLGDALLTGFKPKVNEISALVQGVAQQITAAQQSAAMAMAQAAASTTPRSAQVPAAKAAGSAAATSKTTNLSVSVQAAKKQSVAEALQQARSIAAQIIFSV